jgi:flagella basal body P-ring formation protein FlgA
MIMRYFGLILVFCFFLSPLAFAQNTWQSHESIREGAEAFVLSQLNEGSNVQVKVGQLDNRLRLKQCSQALSVAWPPGSRKSGNASVKVSCEGLMPWKIYVQTSISIMQNIAVLDRSVVRGEQLSMSVIRYEKRDVSRLNGRYINDAKHLLNYRFKRASHKGKTLLPRMLEAPLLVKRNERISIVAGNSALQVKMHGKALSDGVKGKLIRVKNISSNRIVQGEVIKKGVVRIIH